MRLLTPYWPTRRSMNSDIFAEMDRMFGNFGQTAVGKTTEAAFSPACEISETETHYQMSVDLPGIKKEDVKIELNDNTLTISGERKSEKKAGDERNVKYVEKYYGTFTRSFTLPTTVDTEKIEARYEDGVLSLEIPKAPLARTRKIEIQ